MLENKFPTRQYNVLVPPDVLPVREMPVPTTGIFDSADYCLPAVSKEWVVYLIGRLHELADEQRWQGTDVEKWHARQQIEEFLAAIQGC